MVDHLDTAEDALGAATLKRYDALIVDLMLPGMDGLQLIEGLRGRGVTTPILILSARRTVDDRVQGLRMGGDDYLTKPFSFSELHVRIEALIRRARIGDGDGASRDGRRSASASQVTKLDVGDIEMDLLSREVCRQGRPLA